MKRMFADHQWQEDLFFLAKALIQTHSNPFHTVSEAEFQESVSSLSQRIPFLTDNEIIVGLLEITALIQDWHTQIISSNLTSCWFPVRIEWLKEGLFILATSPEYAQWVGTRVLNVGSCSDSEAFQRVKGIAAHDNEYSQQYFAAMFFSMPSILNGLQMIPSTGILPITIQTMTGEKQEVYISACDFSSDDDLTWFWLKETAPAKECVTVSTGVDHLPFYWKNTDRYYWFEYLKAHHAVYVAFNMTLDQKDEPFGEFDKRLWTFIDQKDVHRLIIDLRHNLGGDHDILQPFIQNLLRHPQINSPECLFVIIGPKNVSASAHFTTWLEKDARPTFVGEPTGARPNQYADPEHLRLPNSQLRLMVSQIYWENSFPEDHRPAILPHIPAAFSPEEYFNLIDPALEKIITFFQI